MHTPPVTVGPDTTLADAVRLLNERQVGAAAVIDAGGQLAGVITERDVLRAVGSGTDPAATPVDALMTKTPVTVDADATAAAALEIFTTHRFRHLPVVEDGRVVGILSIRHIVKAAHIEDVKPAGSAPQLAPPGLEGVAVAETSVGDVRGEEGFFHYRGYDATELARHCSFEQVWHLLLVGELPDAAQLTAFKARVAGARRITTEVDNAVAAIAAVPGYTPLRALCAAVAVAANALEMKPTLDIDAAAVQQDCVAIAAIVPALLTRLQAHHDGRQRTDPDDDLGYAASYVQMVTGRRPEPAAARALEQYLILTMDHGFNSSTFTARVITSTGSDVGSALTGAIGALAGPLHGGAPSRALAMLDAIGTPDAAEAYLRKGDRGRPQADGLRASRVQDGRSPVDPASRGRPAARRGHRRLRPGGGGHRAARPQRAEAGPPPLHQRRVLRGRGDEQRGHPARHVHAHVRLQPHRGLDGGIAEQAANNRLIRPLALYTGPAAPRPLPKAYVYQ